MSVPRYKPRPRPSIITIDRALTDRNLLGAALGNQRTWANWLVVLKSAFGLSLSDDELKAFAAVAGSRAPPTKRVRELWAIIGRRGGKSRIAAALAVYIACFTKHKLAQGEIGMALVLAASQAQARTVFEYVKGFINASPVLRQEVLGSTTSEITLINGVVIGVHSNSFRTVRGRTLICCHWGQNSDDALVVAGPTTAFNGTLSEETIAAQRAADPTSASSEWDAEFRSDISTLYDDELIEAAVEGGRPLELPPRATGYYRGFVDASGGVGSDSYTCAVGHKENEQFIIDLVRGTPHGQKFDPQEVTKQYAAVLKEYRCSSVIGDNYAAQWVAQAWRSTGITYIKSDLPKSQIYLECIPLFTRALVRLPDHAKLLRELRLLERHVHRSGKDHVDHPKNGSDDYANAVCGVLHSLAARFGYSLDPFQPGFVDRDAPPPQTAPPQPVEANGDWWKSQQHLRAVPTSNSEAEMHNMYSALENAIRWGQLR